MAADFINYVQEIRGTQEIGQTALPTEEDGIYHDLVRKTTENDDVTPRLGDGIYGSIQVMYADTSVIRDNIDNVNTVADNIADVVIVGTNIADVTTTANLETEITAIIAMQTELLSIFADKITLDSLYADKITLDSIFADKATLDSIFADKATLDSLFTDKVILDSLYADKATLDRLFTSIGNIDIVAANIDDIDIIAANIDDISHFAETYYGPLAVAPTIISHPTLTIGDMYFDTSLSVPMFKTYRATGWGYPFKSTMNKERILATAGQTAFVVPDGYTPGYLDVLRNGTDLDDPDFTATDGINVVLTLGANLNDVMTFKKYDSFSVSGGGDLLSTNNLSDVASAATSRTNLGLQIGTNVQAYDANIVSDASYVHTDNNLTNILKTGYDTAYTHSQAAHAPTNADNTATNETSHADVLVDADISVTVQAYDATLEIGATTDQTGAEIKVAYETEANTNAYTDAEKTKLTGIATGADVTSTNETSHADVLVDGDIGTTVLSPTGDGSGLTAMTKAQVGLSNVDNTSDAAKVLARYDTGIKQGGVATLNTDIKKIDIEATEYTIQGVDYSYAGITGYSPNLQVGESARRIGLGVSGLVDQAGKFTDAQKQTILPICRIQAPQGQTGPGSDLLSPMPTHYYIGEDGWRKRLWHEKAIGVLYANGGVISENVTPLRLNETTGLLYNGQGHDVVINGGTAITGVAVYHVATVWTPQTDATIVINTSQYDNGTDLVALSNNKWAMHTLLRSPKEDGEFFVIYSQAEYASQAEAEAVSPDYGFFLSQQFSDMVAVAQIIVQQGDTSITQIKDVRPFIGGNVGATLGTANLQQTLDNSIDPEMAMQSTLTFKEGTNVATVDVVEVTNFANTQVLAVTGEGNVTLSGTVDGRDVATDGTKLDGVATGADVTSSSETSHADVVVDADIGVNVQAYNAANALTTDITYETLNTAGDVGTSAGQLAIGNHTHTGVYEPSDAGLTSIAGLTTLADRMIYTTASDTYAVAVLTAAGRALLDDANASTQRTTLGLAIGSDVMAYDATMLVDADIGSTVQAYSSVLDATTASFLVADETKLDGIEASANNYSHPTGSGNYHITDDGTNDGKVLTASVVGGTFTWSTIAGGGDLLSTNNLSDVASAATSRTNLGLAIGTNVQAHSAVLDATTASFLTADETKLDGIEASANNYTHPTGDGNLHVPANSTTNDGKVLTASAVAGTYTWETPTGGFTDPMTTRGDLIFKNASGVTVRLPAGTVGQVLTSDGTDIAWATGGGGGGIGEFIDSSIAISAADTALTNDDGTDNNNIGMGNLALYSLTTGINNIAMGENSGSVTNGDGNVAIGVNSFQYATSGDNNVAIGNAALRGAIAGFSGSTNIGIGSSLGNDLTTGSGNILVGSGPGANLTTGYQNTLLGSSAGQGLTTGRENVSLGYQSLVGMTTGYRNIAIGYQALYGASAVSANWNIAMGESALRSLTYGDGNIGIGQNAGFDISTGGANILLGSGTGENITSGSGNILMGLSTGKDMTTTSYNVGMGAQALENPKGTKNVAIGYLAINGGAGAAVCDENIGIGSLTMYDLTTGDYNTCVGSSAGFALTTGSKNILIGFEAGNALTTEVSQLWIGDNGTAPLIGGDFVNDTIDLNGSVAVKEFLTLTPTAVTPSNNSFFVDSADNILKFKDNSGTVKTVNLT